MPWKLDEKVMTVINDLAVGTVVRSKAGRDKGQFFIVGERAEGDAVFVYDGVRRPLHRPKKKNVKHLAKTRTVIPQMASILKDPDQRYNAFIKKTLKPFQDEI